MMNLQLPSNKMKALWLTEFGVQPELRIMDVPKPEKREVLIRIEASPINPSDASFLQGHYSSPKQLPVIPGFEASGQVVATGSNFMAKRLLGKKVACFAPTKGNGCWAEYMVTDFSFVVPLKQKIQSDQGSMLLINPMSALAMVDICRKNKYKAMVNTAAASALGRILIKACADANITLINVVRRQEQVDLLKSLGAKYILNSSEENYLAELRAHCGQYNAKIAFDAIGSTSTYNLLNALPDGSEVHVYGGLSGEKSISANVQDIIFKRKSVRGFWLSTWIAGQSIFKILETAKKARKIISAGNEITIQKKMPLEAFKSGMEDYLNNMTAGKVLLCPSMTIKE
jgi:NADPH:quinone reductase